MKRIIDGKLYDTEKAEVLCEHSYSNPGDFYYVYEALYKSPGGHFFIEYEGVLCLSMESNVDKMNALVQMEFVL